MENARTTKVKKDEKDLKIERLEQELKFAKNQMANVLSLYDEAKQEAEQAVKAKGEFISKLSHEFRTPMNALMGYSDILVKMSKDKSTERYTAGIKSATNRLLNLVNDLIEVSRMESGTTVSNDEEYGMDILISSILDSMSDEVAEKGLLLKVTVDSKMPTRLYGDFYHLRQIVGNLMDNAVKYTDKGYISLEVDAYIGDELNENGRKQAQISFIVKDTGTGIRKKDQDKLFHAFAQFNSRNPYANEGAGIGLTVAKYYSNKMHGDITFESKYGEGSCFVCTVIQEVVDDTPLNIEGDFVASVRSSITFTAPEAQILIVDDSMVNLNVAKGLLSDYCINADTAGGGLEAVKKVGKKKYDLIFMDHMMPDIDGIEAMKLIREKGDWCEKVPIIALTANVTDEARKLFKMEGMEDFLAKPIELSLLRDILVKWLPKDKIVFDDISKAYEKKEEYTADTVFTVPRLAKIDIDLAKGLSYFGGNLEAYKSTVRDIVKDCSKKIIITEMHLNNQDWKNYAIEAHSVKSVSASIGADIFSAKAKEMEFKGKEGAADYIMENGSTFISDYEKFLVSLSELLAEEDEFQKARVAEMASADDSIPDDVAEESCDDEADMSVEEIKGIVGEALSALQDYEIDVACAKLKRLCELKKQVDLVQKIYKVLELIDDFEYDEAEEMLKSLM